MALTVAQAFNIAFEYWEDSKDVIDSVSSTPPVTESSKPNGIVITRTPLEDLPECSKYFRLG